MKDLQLKNCRLNDRYNIRDLLGRGSYAEIYIAEDVHASPHTPHQTVVIKALNVFLQNDLDHDLERTPGRKLPERSDRPGSGQTPKHHQPARSRNGKRP